MSTGRLCARPSSRLLSLPDVLAVRENNDCIIAHNPTDLLDVKSLPGPRLLVLHITLESLVLEQHAETLEDSFHMAMLEAMAAGLPVLGNRHPSSPIVQAVSGFLSDNPAELHSFAQLLLDDLPLALKLGRAAQRTVMERFPPEAFRCALKRAITASQAKWQEAFVSAAH
jgi:hypothetical protein